ncbi:hypothetical protein C5167_044040 [Papaver somniferum]|uniref:Uncharacterized protein n=1 Tax=Papaver somniferum TaxID=3469 RepID=A0A4Y7LB94_PAPSO|nr:hypothetical protein C5167_044040 [Papaver somniferum]
MISFYRFPDHYEKNVKALVLAMALITKPKDNHQVPSSSLLVVLNLAPKIGLNQPDIYGHGSIR